MINTVMNLLRADSRVLDFKIRIHRKKSFELFFVKGKLETVRRADVQDTEIRIFILKKHLIYRTRVIGCREVLRGYEMIFV